MATIEPFRGLRYDDTSRLSALTSPPYDVIDSKLQQELLSEPENISHLDFNDGSTDLNDPDNRYRRAAIALGQWRDGGVLKRESSPAIYVYEQTYDWAGERLTRRSFIARVRLEPLGTSIHPHEQTFSGPKQDRFNLTVATRCNLSQVLGIFPDDASEVQNLFAGTVERQPELVAVGRDNVVNKVWIETDPDVCRAVTLAMAQRHIYIADGHHRYETALRYLSWLEDERPVADDHPARYTSIVLAGSGDTGLRVMPTHRVLSDLRGFDLAAFRQQASHGFAWRNVDLDSNDGDSLETWIADQPLNTIGVLTRDGVSLLTPRSDQIVAARLPKASEALRGLNVSVLHQGLLPEYLEPLCGTGHCAYVHLASEAVQHLKDGADVAFLLRATPLQTVLDVAGNHELMPQKSTYFYPKVLTGLVMYPLSE